MRLLAPFALLFALLGCSPIDWLSITRPLAENEFAQRCAQSAGLTMSRPAFSGGVRSDNPNLDSNLWLLFDAGADFVEFNRTGPFEEDPDPAFIAEWGALPESAVVAWRLERRPAGDPACAAFERWLARMQHTPEKDRPLRGRWLQRASYRDHCLLVRFRPETETHAITPDYPIPIYYFREDGASLGDIGSACYDGSERRSAVADGYGRRILELRTYTLREGNGCIIDGVHFLIASCGDPDDTDLVQGKRIFYPSPTPGHDTGIDMSVHEERCMAKGACWRHAAPVVHPQPG